MKKSKIVAIIAYVLIVIGIFVTAGSLFPLEESETVTIPAGEGYYWTWEVSFWLNGHLSGDFEVIGTGSVQVFVLTSDQYDEYAWDLVPSDSLDEVEGASGTFSADLPDTSSFYLAVNHDAGYDSVEQEVRMTFKVTGLDLTYLIIGVVILVVGAVLAVLSGRMKAKEKASEVAPLQPQSQPTDVTMFDTRQKTQ